MQVAFWVRSCARPSKNRSSILICYFCMVSTKHLLLLRTLSICLPLPHPPAASPTARSCRTVPSAAAAAAGAPETRAGTAGWTPLRSRACQGSAAGCCLLAAVPHLGVLGRPLPPFPAPALTARSAASSAACTRAAPWLSSGAAALRVKETPQDKPSSRRAAGAWTNVLTPDHPPRILFPVPSSRGAHTRVQSCTERTAARERAARCRAALLRPPCQPPSNGSFYFISGRGDFSSPFHSLFVSLSPSGSRNS